MTDDNLCYLKQDTHVDIEFIYAKIIYIKKLCLNTESDWSKHTHTHTSLPSCSIAALQCRMNVWLLTVCRTSLHQFTIYELGF